MHNYFYQISINLKLNLHSNCISLRHSGSTYIYFLIDLKVVSALVGFFRTYITFIYTVYVRFSVKYLHKKTSIWRHNDNIWRTSDAARGGSTGFQRWKLYLIDKLGIVNKSLMEHLFTDMLSVFSFSFRINSVV